MIYFVSAQTTLLNEGILQYQEPQISEEEDVCKKLGFCWDDNKCYPIGYIQGEKYCSDKDPYYFEKYKIEVSNFVNKSETGKECINNYECKTNICSENLCLNLTKVEKNTIFLNKETTNIVPEVIDIKDDIDTEINVEEEKKNIFQKVIGFLEKLFRFG